MKKNEASSTDSGVLSNPFSFLHSGDFGFGSGGPYGRNSDGYYWTMDSQSKRYSYSLRAVEAEVAPQYPIYRGYGFAVRETSSNHKHYVIIILCCSLEISESFIHKSCICGAGRAH